MNRIPIYESPKQWIQAMWDANLLFHFDDDPGDLINFSTNKQLFSDSEVHILRLYIDLMWKDIKLANNGEDPFDIALELIDKEEKP